MSIVRRDQFTGSNNIAKPERLPEGAVVDAVNMDFTVGGKMELRTGFTKVYEGANIRAVFTADDGVVIVEGSEVKFLTGNHAQTVATLQDAVGKVSAVRHAGRLYLNTHLDALVIGHGSVQPWFIDVPLCDVELVAGSMKPGIYQVAVTRQEYGKESGCVPAHIAVAEGQAIKVTTGQASGLRLYCSARNSNILYEQGSVTGSTVINEPVDNTARLLTGMLSKLPFSENLCSYKGIIIGSTGSRLYHTRPLTPHLHDPERDYFQFPADITLVAATQEGVYVCADKTYFLHGIGTDEPGMREVAQFGGIAGTQVQLPDGSAAWFSKYGQIKTAPDGGIIEMNKQAYAPAIGDEGAACFVEHNSNQMIVTAMQGSQQQSQLKSVDHWEIEIT